jgi:predicted component of type VI protein secretion system
VTRPHAVTAADLYLGLVLDELQAQGEVLRQIRDRLSEPAKAEEPAPAPVEEPVPQPVDQPIEVAEPAPKRAKRAPQNERRRTAN